MRAEAEAEGDELIHERGQRTLRRTAQRSELRRIFSGTGFFLLLNYFSGTGCLLLNHFSGTGFLLLNDYSGTGGHRDILITK